MTIASTIIAFSPEPLFILRKAFDMVMDIQTGMKCYQMMSGSLSDVVQETQSRFYIDNIIVRFEELDTQNHRSSLVLGLGGNEIFLHQCDITRKRPWLSLNGEAENNLTWNVDNIQLILKAFPDGEYVSMIKKTNFLL